MRINVYAEELTYETIFITKKVDGRRFYGLRLFLKSASELHHTPTDDDRSAITFWVPWINGENHHEVLQRMFDSLMKTSFAAQHHDKLEMEREKKSRY